jgi:hypothetical protein
MPVIVIAGEALPLSQPRERSQCPRQESNLEPSD